MTEHSPDQHTSESVLSAHQRKELERKEREHERQQEQKARERKEHFKKHATRGVIVILIVMMGYWFYSGWINQEKPFTSSDVHWHTSLEMSICGQVKNLPKAPPGQGHFGNALLHTHDDDLVHVEGRVFKKEQITLGEFFDAINVNFDKDRFFDRNNGDLCDGKPSRVKVLLDGQLHEDPRSILSLDGQKVKIAFEP